MSSKKRRFERVRSIALSEYQGHGYNGLCSKMIDGLCIFHCSITSIYPIKLFKYILAISITLFLFAVHYVLSISVTTT